MKKICLIGSNGFIGKNIYEKLKLNKNLKITRFSSFKNKFEDEVNNLEFDTIIFCAGIHPNIHSNNQKTIFESKKIIRNCRSLFLKSKNIIFFSSYLTLFETSKSIIDENNKYDFYKYENEYGKSKIILEKFFLKFCKYFKKDYLILCPTHVIGPNDPKINPNNKFLLDIEKKKIILFPDVYIPLVDVRNIANFVEKAVFKEKLGKKKIILNDQSIKLSKYIYSIKHKSFYLKIPINRKLILYINKLLNTFNYQILNRRRIKYIEMNPFVKNNTLNINFNLDETINDTKLFFENREDE